MAETQRFTPDIGLVALNAKILKNYSAVLHALYPFREVPFETDNFAKLTPGYSAADAERGIDFGLEDELIVLENEHYKLTDPGRDVVKFLNELAKMK